MHLLAQKPIFLSLFTLWLLHFFLFTPLKHYIWNVKQPSNFMTIDIKRRRFPFREIVSKQNQKKSYFPRLLPNSWSSATLAIRVKPIQPIIKAFNNYLRLYINQTHLCQIQIDYISRQSLGWFSNLRNDDELCSTGKGRSRPLQGQIRFKISKGRPPIPRRSNSSVPQKGPICTARWVWLSGLPLRRPRIPRSRGTWIFPFLLSVSVIFSGQTLFWHCLRFW